MYDGLCRYHSENWKLLGNAVYSYTNIKIVTYYILARFKTWFKHSIKMVQQCWNILCMLCVNLVGLVNENKFFATEYMNRLCNHLHTCCIVHLLSAVALLISFFFSENIWKILHLTQWRRSVVAPKEFPRHSTPTCFHL